MKLTLAIFAAVALSLAAAGSAPAASLVYMATLNGATEVPPVSSLGTGTATVTIDDVALTMHVQATFADLTGTTTLAHIHCCTSPGVPNAPVATPLPLFPGFPTGVTSGSYDMTFDLTQASSFNSTFITNNGGTVDSARAVLLAGLAAGTTYFNIHTSFAGGGEIRGILLAVPEPALLGLTLLGLGALALRRAA